MMQNNDAHEKRNAISLSQAVWIVQYTLYMLQCNVPDICEG